MKKAQWLKKPVSFTSLSLHGTSFMNSGKSSVFFTIGESDTLTLSASPADPLNVSFIFLHTPEDKIIFSSGKVYISFFGFKSEHNMFKPITELKIDKNGDEITFSSDDEVILKIKNPAFFSSSSFGIEIDGIGAAGIEVW